MCLITIVFKVLYVFLHCEQLIRLFYIAVIVQLTFEENNLDHDFFKNYKVAIC